MTALDYQREDYRAFLESKFRFSQAQGFDLPLESINPDLKPMTRDIVRWAVHGGRRAIFAAFGLHKTVTQLEIMRVIGQYGGGLRLIVLPLGVRQEFKRDAAQRFAGDFSVDVKFIRRPEEITDERPIYLTNYESIRDGKLDPNLFTAASLDEASVLRSFGSKTYQTFLTLFEDVPYRFVATATPSPNRYKELIHYAGFLGIMDTGHALTRFFQRDSEKAGNLTLYPHMEQEFFTWLHSWALFIQSPADLGYSNDGYSLPPLKVHYHELPTPAPIGKFDRDGQGKMIADAALSLKDAAEEKRSSLVARVAKMMEIIEASRDDHFILWHDLEDERRAIEKALPGVKSVYGSLDQDEAEARLVAFGDGVTQFLPAKPEMSGSGGNYQRHCHKEIFLGIGYKFNDFVQGIHRVQRFGQSHEVEIHIIYTEAERQILAALQAKWQEDTALRERMSDIIREHGLNAIGLEQQLARSIGCERQLVKSERFELVNNDSVEEYRSIESNRFHFMATSIPFGDHFEYVESYNDFGHNAGHAPFFRQMDFLTPELHRTLRPGRVLAVHVKDRIRFGNVTGYGMPSVEPFHADCIAHYRKHGFVYFGMITVVTDVVRENNQTYRLSWTEQCKDGTKMGVGSPEYVLLFRKLPTDTSRGYADERVSKSKPLVREEDGYTRPYGGSGETRPIVPGSGYSLGRWQIDAHSFWRSSGNRLLTPDELARYGPDTIGRLYEQYSLTTVYDYEEHVRLAEGLEERKALPRLFMCLQPASHHPDVWHDVTRMRTLNGDQAQRNLTKHVCPLQFDIVDRLITRYSNPDEEVSDPFGGLFTVPVRAIKLGRRGHGVELNAEYFRDGLRYARAAEREFAMPTLFDMARVQGENGTTEVPA
jgi:SAM-dependent methyltransferase